MTSEIIRTKEFIEAQGFIMNQNIISQNNKSMMKLKDNGEESNGKRTKHFNIESFYVTDLMKKNEMEIQYCLTNNMITNFYNEPMLDEKFKLFWKALMNTELLYMINQIVGVC